MVRPGSQSPLSLPPWRGLAALLLQKCDRHTPFGCQVPTTLWEPLSSLRGPQVWPLIGCWCWAPPQRRLLASPRTCPSSWPASGRVCRTHRIYEQPRGSSCCQARLCSELPALTCPGGALLCLHQLMSGPHGGREAWDGSRLGQARGSSGLQCQGGCCTRSRAGTVLTGHELPLALSLG